MIMTMIVTDCDCGYLELQELADVVEDCPAPQHGLDDGAKVVVHDHDVRGLLGD